MTRVNVIPPKSLNRQMLFAECREIVRVFSLARKSTQDFRNRYQWALKKKVPSKYVLGEGHVLFFVDKIAFLNERYKALCIEWRSRGYNINQISEEDLLKDIDISFMGSYTPTQEAIQLNMQRIEQRLKEMKK